MSVHYLEQYLMADDLDAGVMLLHHLNQTPEYDQYQNKVTWIAQQYSRSCPQHFNDIVQEAHIKVLNQVRSFKFVSGFFCRAFRAQGGRINQVEPHLIEILEVPTVIQRHAAQLYPKEPLRLQYEKVCFHSQYVNLSQPPALLLTCTHPLRTATIELELRTAGVSDKTLRQFYKWATETAKNQIIDYIRALQSEQRNQRTLLIALSSSQNDSDRQDSAIEIEIDDITEFIASLNQAHPNKQYLQLWYGLVEEKTQKQIAIELGVAQSEVTKRKQELIFYVMEWDGLIDAAEATDRRRAIRRSTPVDRSNTDY